MGVYEQRGRIMKLSKTIGIVALITVLSVLLVVMPGCKKAVDHPTGEHPAKEKPAEPKPSSEPPVEDPFLEIPFMEDPLLEDIPDEDIPDEERSFNGNRTEMYTTGWQMSFDDDDPNDDDPDEPDHPEHPEHPGIE
jgi:hypothetical protein